MNYIMSLQMRVVLILGAVATMASMLRRIRKKKVGIDVSIFWILFSSMLVVISVFPQIVYFFARILGVISPANLVMAGVILLLIIRMFLMTLEISELKEKMRGIAQSVALREGPEGSGFSDGASDPGPGVPDGAGSR